MISRTDDLFHTTAGTHGGRPFTTRAKIRENLAREFESKAEKIFVLDEARRIVFANTRALADLGLKHSNTIEGIDLCTVLECGCTDNGHREPCLIEEAVRSGIQGMSVYHKGELQATDGTRSPLRLSSSPFPAVDDTYAVLSVEPSLSLRQLEAGGGHPGDVEGPSRPGDKENRGGGKLRPIRFRRTG